MAVKGQKVFSELETFDYNVYRIREHEARHWNLLLAGVHSWNRGVWT